MSLDLATHEAAHAIMAMTFGGSVPLQEVSIERKGTSLGRCNHGDCNPEQRAMIAAAGVEADRRILGSKINVASWKSDLAIIQSAAREVAGESVSARINLITGWHQRTREILFAEQVWSEVERFARLLLKLKRIDFRHLAER